MAFTALKQSDQWILQNCVYALENARDFGLLDADVVAATSTANLVTRMQAYITKPADEPFKYQFAILNTGLAAGAWVEADITGATTITGVSNGIADVTEYGTAFRGKQTDGQAHP